MNPPSEYDAYAYEIEQEKIAEFKGMHQPMKRWYNERGGATTLKWGEFPTFWQDLETWTAYREVKKAYLMHLEGIEIDSEAHAESSEMKQESSYRNMATEVEQSETPKSVILSSGSSIELSTDNLESGNTEEEGVGDDGKKRKRKNRWGEAKKSRWGDKISVPGTGTETDKLSRRSRWSVEGAINVSSESTEGAQGVLPNLTQEQIQETLVLQMRLKQVNERMVTVVQDALVREQDPNKTPSPPPKYDVDGKRVNTREVRMREALDLERGNIIETMMKLNPMFQAPIDYIRRKPCRRLYIPQREYPGYNFIGLIIGPRGNTQKRMERESGCKIAIRGRGSVKEGARRTMVKTVDEEDDLHVYVQGDTEEQVEKAAAEVAALLRPVDDELNEHKQKQLRELALINGTLRDDEYCHVCGEKGHRQFECPKRAGQIRPGVEVRCAICGDASHPTRDCRQAPGMGGGVADATKAAALDTEYLNFMAELGDRGAQTQQKQQVRQGTGKDAQISSQVQSSQSAVPHIVYTPPTTAATKEIPHVVYQPPKPAAPTPVPPLPTFAAATSQPLINPYGLFPPAGMPTLPMPFPMPPTSLGISGSMPLLLPPFMPPFGGMSSLPFPPPGSTDTFQFPPGKKDDVHFPPLPTQPPLMGLPDPLSNPYSNAYAQQFASMSFEESNRQGFGYNPLLMPSLGQFPMPPMPGFFPGPLPPLPPGDNSMPPPLPVPINRSSEMQPPLPESQPPLPPPPSI